MDLSTQSHTLPERIARGVARGTSLLPVGVKRLIAGKPIRVDDQELDLDAQAGVRLLNVVTKSFDRLPVEEARAQATSEAWVFGDELPVETVRDITIPGPAGEIPARLYRPSGIDGPAAALVYCHGGGWVLGDLSASDSVARYLAQYASLMVIAVDYRLAPEHPFPFGLDDALAAFAHIAANATEFGIDAHAIGVGGESSGGNLATVIAQQTALAARKAPTPVPAFQLLFMPITDVSTKHGSYRLFGDGYFLTEAVMDWYKNHYLTDPALVTDPRVSPLLQDDLSGVAPAYIAVAGFDVLRDEGEAYARKLAAAGVPTAIRRHPGVIHSLVNATGISPIAREVLLEASGALRMGLTALAGLPDGTPKTPF
ncbi:alpha/beta hydrolase [Nocardia sp. NPDC049707]|uniref:alpha/beta hydrolase n=1 Tax=Nocardia sp. NPDC049707 TaxID=3154735 RepID=UPI003415808E